VTSIVVLESGRHEVLRSIADALADALRDRASVPSGETVGPTVRIALPEAEPSRDPQGADCVVALDAASLARAAELRVPTRVAWVGWLDAEWEDVIARADLVVVAHPALADAMIAIGAARSRVRVGPMLAPAGSLDRAAARAALALDPDAPVVIVPGEVIGDDLTGMLLQLALARDGIRFLFDVGRDATLADSLRRRAAFPALMFAEGPIAEQAWAAADRALARVDGPELLRALAHDVAPILAPPRAVDAIVARALARDGLATVAASDATLAVAIDEACAPAHLATARAALASLDARSGAERLASMVRAALEERSGARTPEGLPRGLEPIGPAPDGAARLPDAPRPSKDDAIERELQALRERIARGSES
jgi:hypothetical protein